MLMQRKNYMYIIYVIIELYFILSILLANLITPIFSKVWSTKNNKTSLRISLLIIIGILILSSSITKELPEAVAQSERDAMPQTQKVELIIDVLNLDLVWNGDQGEEGRGRGEVYVSVWVNLPTKTETDRLQHKEAGPLGGDPEFPSGTIKEDPPNSGKFTIKAASVPVTDLKFKFQADCPVPKELVFDVLVWEEDSDKKLEEFRDLLAEGADKAATQVANANSIPLPSELAGAAFKALFDLFFSSGDDSLGRIVTEKIEIPDPCPDGFDEFKKTFELENLAKQLWLDVNAEADDGTAFSSKGINPPDNIGSIDLKITALKLEGLTSSKADKDDPPSIKELSSVNLGRPENDVVLGQLYLGASIPDESLSIDYNFFLDVDNNLSTGSQDYHAHGAEFMMQLAFENSNIPISRLFKFNSNSNLFEEVPNGIHDSMISIDRSIIFLSVKLSTLGDQVTHIAGWGVIEDDTGIADILPPNPEMLAPVITVKGAQILLSSNPVFLNNILQIEINKNNINGNENVLVNQIMLTKPSGEELVYTDLPIDITNSATISFPSSNWLSSINNEPRIDVVGPWMLNVKVTITYEDGVTLTQDMEEVFHITFFTKPEFPFAVLAIVAPLAVLSIYIYRKKNN